MATSMRFDPMRLACKNAKQPTECRRTFTPGGDANPRSTNTGRRGDNTRTLRINSQGGELRGVRLLGQHLPDESSLMNSLAPTENAWKTLCGPAISPRTTMGAPTTAAEQCSASLVSSSKPLPTVAAGYDQALMLISRRSGTGNCELALYT